MNVFALFFKKSRISGLFWITPFCTLFVNPIYCLGQSNTRGIEKKDIRRGMVIAQPKQNSRQAIELYGTPLGSLSSVPGMQSSQALQPELGVSFPLGATKPKLTKADAARVLNTHKPVWALDLHVNDYILTPHHLLDGHEQQVSSFAAIQNTRKNWNLYALSLGPELRLGGESWLVGIQAGPALVQNKPAQFQQGDPGQNTLYQDYHVGTDFHKLRAGAQGNIRLKWYPFAHFPLGLYVKAGYFWQQSYTFQVRERDISKVDFSMSPDEIRYQLSNGQIAPFVEKSYSIPHSFFQGQIGLSLCIKNKSSRYRMESPQTGRLVIKNKSPRYRVESPGGAPQEGKQGFQIVLDQPRPHAVFRSADAIPPFQWHVVGQPPADAQYLLEVFQLNDRGGVEQRVVGASVQPGRPYRLTETERAAMRQINRNTYYSWKVTETTTGTSSGQPLYSVQTASCGTVSDSIHIECDGWDVQSGLPKYHVTICLTNTPTNGTSGCNATYTSLTSTSGGSISSISTLPLTLTPNSTGCLSFTYSPASLSQTSATFQLNGNWSDPLNNTVNILSQDSLPVCICRDCDSMDIQINNPQVQMQATNPHLFDITGAVQVTSHSIYALEFSIQSFSFTAQPGGCATVDSVEHDGMIVSAGTTVNGGSSGLIFGNVPIGNPNVFKLLKWVSPSPVLANTPVPFDLVVSLPAASSGLDPSCCQIQYQLCLEVKVYYDACRFCTKTICLQFSNSTPQKP
ncbi:hypothetical protein [Thermoflavifilum thermophilum]|uniref:Uncharacterized protein n=1 Tax=Thermoflavifilum thermophilum TaxID=1393122 RepID=A0A1I7NDQ4_9BACT|nr:hypothetical protein [Thermoflavifilum thermophilum]SFV32790.1 hypothetical protein SAMN05660895_1457 [Thermoflavifilum thermophilum]